MRRGLALLGLLLFAAGCRGPQPEQPALPRPPRDQVSLQLNWFPEAEHGGFFAAQVHSYYDAMGLEVDLKPGGPDAPVVPQVANGTATFGVSNCEAVLLGRAQEAPVVALMAAMQHSPRCIMVHAESGIEKLEDLGHVTLAMSAQRAFSQYLRKHVPLEGVTIVPYPGNISQFLLKPDYAQQAYVFSEPYLAEQKGCKVRSLMLSDLGFDDYTSVLITSEKVIREQPDLVKRMVAATVKGWERYLEGDTETDQRIHELNPEMALDVLVYGCEAIRPLAVDDETKLHGLGWMSLERWQRMADQLAEIDALEAGSVKPEEAFTTAFLPSDAGS